MERSTRRGLYDDAPAEELKKAFQNDALPRDERLTEEEFATLRLRNGYVFTLCVNRIDSTTSVEPKAVLNWDLALIDMAQKIESFFTNDPVDDSDTQDTSKTIELDKIFVGPQEGIVERFGVRARTDAEAELAPLRLQNLGDLEVWVGIGLRKLSRDRYTPSMRVPWQPNRLPQPAGITISPDARATDPNSFSVGPVTIPYCHLLRLPVRDDQGRYVRPPLPTIHNWLVWYNRQLHRRVHGDAPSGDPQFSRIRSLTILSPSANPEDRSVLEEWGDRATQFRTGHLLVQFPALSSTDCDYKWDDLGPKLARDLADISAHELPRGKEMVIEGGLRWGAIVEEELSGAGSGMSLADVSAVEKTYSAFLAAVFFFDDQALFERALSQIRMNVPDDRLKRTIDEMLPEFAEFRRFLRCQGKEGPKYQAYTTIALNCDGLTSAPPDSVMFFAGHPIPPKALDTIARYALDVVRPAVSAEADALLRSEALTQGKFDTIKQLIPAFGHDSKRPARIIANVLGREELGEDRFRLAKALTEELESRLTGHSALLSPLSPLKARTNELSLPIGCREIGWRSIEDIWAEALSAVVLGACLPLDAKTTNFASYVRGDSPDAFLRAFLKYPAGSGIDRLNGILGATQHLCPEADACSKTLFLPQIILSGDGNMMMTQRAAPQALRFIFSEILTNVFNHEFSLFAVRTADGQAPIFQLTMEATTTTLLPPILGATPGLATIRVMASPASMPSLSIQSRCYGLLSIKLISESLGASIASRRLSVRPPDASTTIPSTYHYPFPTYDEKRRCSVWQIDNFPVFIR